PCDIESFPDELPPDLANAADPPVFFENTPDLGPQGFIVAGAVRQASRISPLSMRETAQIRQRATRRSSFLALKRKTVPVRVALTQLGIQHRGHVPLSATPVIPTVVSGCTHAASHAPTPLPCENDEGRHSCRPSYR